LLIGFAVEFFQIFIASGVVQGASVVTRAVGLVAGYVGLRIAAQLPLAGLLPWMRPAALVGFIPYAVLVIALSGWQAGGWLGIEEGLDRLASINFLPFYYHYFTTEQKAMFSAVTRAILFAPTGLLAWMWVAGRVRGNTSYAGAWAAGVGAAALAFVTETGLLFFRDTRPDPTNIVIAFFAALSVFAIAEAVSRWTRAASQTSGVQRPPIPESAVAPAEPRPEADAQPAAAAPSPAPVEERQVVGPPGLRRQRQGQRPALDPPGVPALVLALAQADRRRCRGVRRVSDVHDPRALFRCRRWAFPPASRRSRGNIPGSPRCLACQESCRPEPAREY